MDAVAHDQLTWERLKHYNALVLVDFPREGQVTNEPSGGPGSGANQERTLALLDRYLEAGGGVMLNLLQHHYDPTFYNTAQKALARWGARRPLERVLLSPDRVVRHPRLGMDFHYTGNVAASPVSEGVKAVWYPLGGDYWGMAGPVDVDDTWTVVLRTPQSPSSPANAGCLCIPRPVSRNEGNGEREEKSS